MLKPKGISPNLADISPGILAIFNNVAPGREAEFEEWFQHEHLAERIAVPGFLLGRRYEALSGQPRFFNYYLTQSAAAEIAKALTDSFPRSAVGVYRLLCEIRP